MSEKEKLLERLERKPEDWLARVTLIEIAIREGDVSFAKRLVRASPSDVPTPPEIQIRIHTLLTKGVAALSPTTEQPATGPSIQSVQAVAEEAKPEATPIEGLTVKDPLTEDKAVTSADRKKEAVPTSLPASPASPASPYRDLGGGLSALIESEIPLAVEKKPEPRKRRGSYAKAPSLDRVSAKDKWENYEGGLELVVLDPGEYVEPPSTTPERLSSVSLAVLLHVVILVLLGLVVVQVPLPKPPELVVSTVHERVSELVTTRLTKPSIEIKPSAAAAQAIDVVSSVASSSFDIPEVEHSAEVLNSAMQAGIQPVGTGMSFSSEVVKASDVNFFGLSGSGRKIVFIVDATPEMLVDEKGGMAAYDKVKTEVGIMLANLNRGTQFNILLYQGKQLVAFRDELVPGLPSNLRQAISWLDPLNREYESLGLGAGFGPSYDVADHEGLPIQAVDLAHYTKAIQKAMEWQTSSVFCISGGYEGMSRSPDAEMMKKIAAMPAAPANPGTIDPAAQKAWQAAVEKTREWLEKENEARKAKGVSPKVVVNFNQLVREITGASPPSRRGGTPAPGGAALPQMPPVTPEDIEKQIDKLVKSEYKAGGLEEPSLHMVLFLGEEEEIGADEDHFKNLTRKNRGKLKILRGLAALQNVTGAK